jgi:hypothetical protein
MCDSNEERLSYIQFDKLDSYSSCDTEKVSFAELDASKLVLHRAIPSVANEVKSIPREPGRASC